MGALDDAVSVPTVDEIAPAKDEMLLGLTIGREDGRVVSYPSGDLTGKLIPQERGWYKDAKAQGKSIGDLGMQLDFLVKELRESYPAVWKTLTTTSSVQAASDAVLLRFERPADTSERVRRLRAGFGEAFLAELGGTEVPDPVTPPCPAAQTISGTIIIDGTTYRITGEAVS